MSQKKKRSRASSKPRPSWNIQVSPTKKQLSQGPSQKGLNRSAGMPLAKTREEALGQAMITLMGLSLEGKDPGAYSGMTIAFFASPFEKQ
jgi:hypothetical protein